MNSSTKQRLERQRRYQEKMLKDHERLQCFVSRKLMKKVAKAQHPEETRSDVIQRLLAKGLSAP